MSFYSFINSDRYRNMNRNQAIDEYNRYKGYNVPLVSDKSSSNVSNTAPTSSGTKGTNYVDNGYEDNDYSE